VVDFGGMAFLVDSVIRVVLNMCMYISLFFSGFSIW